MQKHVMCVISTHPHQKCSILSQNQCVVDIFKVKTLNAFFSVSQKHELTGSCMEPFNCWFNVTKEM